MTSTTNLSATKVIVACQLALKSIEDDRAERLLKFIQQFKKRWFKPDRTDEEAKEWVKTHTKNLTFSEHWEYNNTTNLYWRDEDDINNLLELAKAVPAGDKFLNVSKEDFALISDFWNKG